MPRANASVTNPPLLVDNDATGMCPVPFLDLYPAISTVFVIIIVIIIDGMAIPGEAKKGKESQAYVATVVVTVMAMLRIGS
jgi:hypothetical protein